MLSVSLRMIDLKTGREIAPELYTQFAKSAQALGFVAQPSGVDDKWIWRGTWLRDNRAFAETPDGYDTHTNALRAAARCLLQATAPSTKVAFTTEQVVLLRRCFDVGAPSSDDLASGQHFLEQTDVDACNDLLRDAYTAVPVLEFDLHPVVASTLHSCFLVGAELIDDGNVPDSEYRAIDRLLKTAINPWNACLTA